eukprot:GAHX01001053.1.p1 GENE.GAHX01001053.1~~GAHX01001053.1.p1  ORF type:complete len:387 (-),score=41.10 GAHX01001053.1:206-1366(-)
MQKLIYKKADKIAFYIMGTTSLFLMYFFISNMSYITPTYKSLTNIYMTSSILITKGLLFLLTHRFGVRVKSLMYIALSIASLITCMFLSGSNSPTTLEHVLGCLGALLAGVSIAVGEITALEIVGSYPERFARLYSAGTGLSGLIATLLPVVTGALEIQFTAQVYIAFAFPLISFVCFSHIINIGNREQKKRLQNDDTGKPLIIKKEDKEILSQEDEGFVQNIRMVFVELLDLFVLELLSYSLYNIMVSGIRGAIDTNANKKTRVLEKSLSFVVRVGVFLARNILMFWTTKKLLFIPVTEILAFIPAILLLHFKANLYFMIVPFVIYGVIYGMSNALVYLHIIKRMPRNKSKFALGLESISNQLGSAIGALIGLAVEKGYRNSIKL